MLSSDGDLCFVQYNFDCLNSLLLLLAAIIIIIVAVARNVFIEGGVLGRAHVVEERLLALDVRGRRCEVCERVKQREGIIKTDRGRDRVRARQTNKERKRDMADVAVVQLVCYLLCFRTLLAAAVMAWFRLGLLESSI